MAKERDWKAIKAEYEAALASRRQELEGQIAGLQKELNELTGRPPRSVPSVRRSKTCSICVAKGLPGTGHTKRTHDRAMMEAK